MSIIKNEDKKSTFKLPFPQSKKIILDQTFTPANYSHSPHHSKFYNYENNDIARTPSNNASNSHFWEFTLPKFKDVAIHPKIHNINIKLQKNQTIRRKKRSWNLLRNIFKGVSNLTRTKTNPIHNEKELVFDIKFGNKRNSSAITISSINPFNEKSFKNGDKNNKTHFFLESLHKKQNFFRLINEGNLENIQEIKNYLKEDPLKFIKEDDDPDRFINQKNCEGMTPLYISCKNGNFEMVKFLLSSKANPHLERILGDYADNLLGVTSRWNYYEILEFLLKTIEWTEKEILLALKNNKKEPKNQCLKLLRSELRKKKRKRKMSIFKKVFCCGCLWFL